MPPRSRDSRPARPSHTRMGGRFIRCVDFYKETMT
jgi:hypothetical protein